MPRPGRGVAARHSPAGGMSRPEVIERDSAEAWQQWLDAVAERERVLEFEPTHPTPLDQAPEDAQGSLRASGP